MTCKDRSYNKKYVCGLPAVKTCHVFAIINVIVVSLAVLSFFIWLGLLFYLNVCYGYEGWLNADLVTTALIVAGGYTASGIAAIFAILLLIGVQKKRPVFVKAYLFYGVVVELISMGAVVVASAIFYLENYKGTDGAFCVAIVLAFCIIYGFCLRLVMSTYIILRNERAHECQAEVQALFMLGPDGKIQVLPLAR